MRLEHTVVRSQRTQRRPSAFRSGELVVKSIIMAGILQGCEDQNGFMRNEYLQSGPGI